MITKAHSGATVTAPGSGIGHPRTNVSKLSATTFRHAECRPSIASHAAFEARAGPKVTARYPFGNAIEGRPPRVYR